MEVRFVAEQHDLRIIGIDRLASDRRRRTCTTGGLGLAEEILGGLLPEEPSAQAR
jgi:hypothetical protein